MTKSRYLFITPPLDGPPTGGTLYDARLLAALVATGGASVERHGIEDGRRALAGGRPGAYWVDSLFLDEFAALASTAKSGQSLGLLCHYLPSLVARGDAWRPADSTPVETAALRAASGIVVPSAWLGGVLESAGVAKSRIYVVEPGIEEAPVTASVEIQGAPEAAVPLAALLVANLVPGKGIAPFLEALATELGSAPPAFVLVVVGSLEQDPEYAAACRAVASSHPSLRGSVVFASAFPPAGVLRALAQAHVFVSASRTETYGMALAEARALGVPILARRGGNVGAHVDLAAGGELFGDDRALAAGLVRLSQDGAELARRRALAAAGSRHRAWEDAALDFLRATPSVS